MNKEYTVDYFIKKFTAIPARRWTTGRFRRDGKRCALGHCGISDVTHYTPEAQALRNIFWKNGHFLGITSINDGDAVRFQQKTPKARILAALRHIKNKC